MKSIIPLILTLSIFGCVNYTPPDDLLAEINDGEVRVHKATGTGSMGRLIQAGDLLVLKDDWDGLEQGKIASVVKAPMRWHDSSNMGAPNRIHRVAGTHTQNSWVLWGDRNDAPDVQPLWPSTYNGTLVAIVRDGKRIDPYK